MDTHNGTPNDRYVGGEVNPGVPYLESIHTELAKPLEPGQLYELSFWHLGTFATYGMIAALNNGDPSHSNMFNGTFDEIVYMSGPPEFAQDESPMIDVAVHALTALKAQGYRPDAVLLLQPTSPLRRPEHLQEAVRLLEDHDAVCSVVPLPQHQCPHYLMSMTDEGFLEFFMPNGARFTRRQDVLQAYWRDGVVFPLRALSSSERPRLNSGRAPSDTPLKLTAPGFSCSGAVRPDGSW